MQNARADADGLVLCIVDKGTRAGHGQRRMGSANSLGSQYRLLATSGAILPVVRHGAGMLLLRHGAVPLRLRSRSAGG